MVVLWRCDECEKMEQFPRGVSQKMKGTPAPVAED